MKGYIFSILGNLYLVKYDLRRAIICYEKALNANTKNAISIYNYGLVTLQSGDFNKALDLIYKSKALNDNILKNSRKNSKKYNRAIILHKNIALALASSYWRLNNLEKAINILEDLRKQFEYINANTLTTLGYFYLLVKNYEKATELTNLALKDDESYFPAWDNLGQIALETNDIPKAKEYFLKSLNINPKSVDSLFNLGIAEEIEQNKEKAIEYFTKALECPINSLNTVTKEIINQKIESLK